MTILSGSFVVYGPRMEPGGDVRAVVCEGAHEDSELRDVSEGLFRGFLSYGRNE
jgi:hypothetical protein